MGKVGTKRGGCTPADGGEETPSRATLDGGICRTRVEKYLNEGIGSVRFARWARPDCKPAQTLNKRLNPSALYTRVIFPSSVTSFRDRYTSESVFIYAPFSARHYQSALHDLRRVDCELP